MKSVAKFLLFTLLSTCFVNKSDGQRVDDGSSIKSHQKATKKNKDFVLKALRATLLEGNPNAVDTYFAPGMIQHNPDIPDGLEARKASVKRLSANGGFKADFVRVLGDGDRVALHARYHGAAGRKAMIAFEVYRLKNGKVVEHWDNLTLEQPPNPSGHTQIDGATEISDHDKTEANVKQVAEFLNKSLVKQEAIDVTKYINQESYIQHSSGVADGLDGFVAYMKELAKKGTPLKYTKIHQVIGEGNFVLTLSEGKLGDRDYAFFDLFRLKDGLLVEHWDVVTPMPGPDAKHNESGKF